MKRVLPLTFLLFTQFICIAQQSRSVMDSIKQVLKSTTSDSIRFQAYSALSFAYTETQMKTDSARLYADSIRLLARIREDQHKLTLAEYHYGVIARFTGDFYKGIAHMQKFIDFHEKSKNQPELLRGLYQIGVMNVQVGEYRNSLQQFQQAKKLAQTLDNKVRLAHINHAMGYICTQINMYDAAIEHFTNSIAANKALHDNRNMAMSMESLGVTYKEIGYFKAAEEKLKETLILVREINRPDGIASVTENLGKLYNEMGDYATALSYHKESLELRKKFDNKKETILGLLTIGETYEKIGNRDLAKSYLVKGLSLAKELNIKPLMITAHKSLAQLHEKMGHHKIAYAHLSRYQGLQDTLLNEEKNKQLVEMETKYQVAQKEREIKILAQENELQVTKTEKAALANNSLFAGMALILLITGLVVYSLRQKLKTQSILASKNEELRLSQFKEQLSSLEMKALRAQMNPHFLFNCMNSINKMILGNQNDEASTYLGKFSKLVRSMLENSEHVHVSLEQELKMLASYIQLESIRFKKKIAVNIVVAENINQENTYIPSMVLQPFVENAIWHGLMHKRGKGKIDIHIKALDDVLECTIEDNGIGRTKALGIRKQEKSDNNSMGIKITTNRLALLTNGKKSEMVRFIDLYDDQNSASGTKVVIKIPTV